MSIVSNAKVYGLEDSIKASKYPMSVDIDSLNDRITDRVKSLGMSKTGTGHDQFLTGIVVQFDLTLSLKAWTEAQRYHFLDFVSSQSTMHRITKFDIDEQCNEYVDEVIANRLQDLIADYNEDRSDVNYLRVLYNIPTGFRLTARMTTNYRQLKTIFYQRRNHRLPEWRTFCDWMLTLPFFKEICVDVEEGAEK